MIYNEANFPELPSSWASLTVDDSVVSAGNSNKKLKTKDSLEYGRFPVIDQGQSDISGYSDDENLVVEASESSPVILFGDHTRLLKKISQPFVPGADGTKLFRAKSFWDTRFVYQMLRAIKLPDKGYARHFQYLRESVLPLPPLPEQKRIADKLEAVLARVDACHDHLDRIPSIIKRFRQSVLSAATSGKLTEDWRDANGIQLDEWKTSTGAEIFSFITSGSRGWASYYSDSGSIFLRIGNLDHETIALDLSEIQYVNPPEGAEGVRTRVQLNDILISITADVGMVGLVSEPIGDAFINQHICLARPKPEHSPRYLAYFLASPTGGLGRLQDLSRGATKVGLTLGDIRELGIQLPSLNEQTEIVRRVECMFAFADRLEARFTVSRAKVEKLTLAILAKAFRGELVPQDPNDEPASELIERISVGRAVKSISLKQVKNKRKEGVSMKPINVIPIFEALLLAKNPLSAQELLVAAGYPTDAETEIVERFFLDVRKELEEKRIERTRKGNDDFFSIVP